jgi:signal peptidase I
MPDESTQQPSHSSEALGDPLVAEVQESAPQEPVSPPITPHEHHDDQTTISEYLESLLVTVILALFGTSFIVQAFKIPSPSMEHTLMVGDHLLVNKFIFGGTGAWYEKLLPYRPIERGDIIVFKYPYSDHQHFVKRVIGLPGDHLKLVDQEMFINGKLLNEPYVQHDPSALGDPLNSYFPPPAKLMISSQMLQEWVDELPKHGVGDELVVPPGKYFAMGDNRDRSSDSRYWGFVDREAIMGRPFLIYWSVDATTSDYAQESTFLARLASVFQSIRNLPARTRWHRMLHTVH